MLRLAHIGPLAAGLIACACICCPLSQSGWSQTNPPASPPDPAIAEALRSWQSTLATLEQLQAQQQATIKAIDRVRGEIESVLADNASNTTAQLNTMSDALTVQREQDLKFIRESNRLLLTVVSGLAGLLFLGFVVLMFISTRATNRLALLMSASSLRYSLPPPAVESAGSLSSRLSSRHSSEPRTAQFQAAIKRLESRIAELEKVANQRQTPDLKPSEVPKASSRTTQVESDKLVSRSGTSPRVALTMGEGEAIGFLPSDVAESRPRTKPKLFGRLRRLFSQPAPVETKAEVKKES